MMNLIQVRSDALKIVESVPCPKCGEAATATRYRAGREVVAQFVECPAGHLKTTDAEGNAARIVLTDPPAADTD